MESNKKRKNIVCIFINGTAHPFVVRMRSGANDKNPWNISLFWAIETFFRFAAHALRNETRSSGMWQVCHDPYSSGICLIHRKIVQIAPNLLIIEENVYDVWVQCAINLQKCEGIDFEWKWIWENAKKSSGANSNCWSQGGGCQSLNLKMMGRHFRMLQKTNFVFSVEHNQIKKSNMGLTHAIPLETLPNRQSLANVR